MNIADKKYVAIDYTLTLFYYRDGPDNPGTGKSPYGQGSRL